MQRYVDKVPTVALLTLGGLTEEQLLTLPGVTRKDVSAARRLLDEKGWSIGKCERCNRVTFVRQVQWETNDARFDAKLCGSCGKICQPPNTRINASLGEGAV